jgi:hypothetical protein
MLTNITFLSAKKSSKYITHGNFQIFGFRRPEINNKVEIWQLELYLYSLSRTYWALMIDFFLTFVTYLKLWKIYHCKRGPRYCKVSFDSQNDKYRYGSQLSSDASPEAYL